MMMPSTTTMLFAALVGAAPAQVLEVRGAPRSQARPTRGPCAQNLSQLARQSASAALPPGYRVQGVFVDGVCLPPELGPWQAQVVLPEVLQQGRNGVAVTFTAPGQRPVQASARVDLTATVAARGAHVVARGAEVKLIVRTANVTVQARAVSQESAGLGEAVQVLPAGGQKVVRGRVVDAQTVEVAL